MNLNSASISGVTCGLGRMANIVGGVAHLHHTFTRGLYHKTLKKATASSAPPAVPQSAILQGTREEQRRIGEDFVS